MRRHPQSPLSPQEVRNETIQRNLRENIKNFYIGDKFIAEKDAKELFGSILRNAGGTQGYQRALYITLREHAFTAAYTSLWYWVRTTDLHHDLYSTLPSVIKNFENCRL
jgi:hypothetical protein